MASGGGGEDRRGVMLNVTRIFPGSGYRYLTEQVAQGRHDFRPAPDSAIVAYFADDTARGEAPGWWTGRGAGVLGMRGFVTEEQIARLIGEGKHPATGEQLGQLWRQYAPMTDEYRQAAVEAGWAKLPEDATFEQKARIWIEIMTMPERHAVAGYDVTVSPVKSVSLLWAFGDDRVRREVMAAHHAGIRAMLDHLEQHGGFTRTGVNGLRQVDTAGLAAMVFDHRMSREKDPQLHSHVVVSSKVRTVDRDGRPKWLSLDSKAFYKATIAARIAYERAVEVELGRRLGARFGFRPGSTIREVIGISADAIRHYSKRRVAIEGEMDQRCTGPDGTRERAPDKRWRRRAQDATLRTRAPKEGAESTRQAAARWQAEDRAAGLDTARQVRLVVAGRVPDEIGQRAGRAILAARARVGERRLTEDDLWAATFDLFDDPDDPRRVAVLDTAIARVPHLAVEKAIEQLSQERAVWNRDHLELAIGRVLRADITAGTDTDWRRVTQLAERAINAGAGGLRVLTPPALVTWGPSLLRDSDKESIYTRHRDLVLTTRAVVAAEQDVIGYAAKRGATLAPAAGIDATATALELSADKTTALRFAVGDDRRVVGVVGPAGSGKTYMQKAVAQVARDAGIPVLGLTVGQNAAELLAAATRMADQTGMRCENVAMWLHAQNMPPEGTSPADWAFAPGQWVIIDEASQASSFDLARLVQLLDKVGGKLILVGDPHQVSAVGPGGLFRYLAGTGNVIELADVHRFATSWEGPASLRLRAADPTVLSEYDQCGRIVGGHRDELVAGMLDGWATDVLAGRRTLMLVETEAEAAELAARARILLIRAGVVHTGQEVALADGTRAGVGDLVVTRRNNRKLTAGEKFVANRDQWKVLAVGPNDALEVENLRTDHTLVLPGRYVAAHVQLAYAATVDSAQGMTVEYARALVDDATTRTRLYVMLTRGEILNAVYVITRPDPAEGHPPPPPGAAVAILADILRRDDTDRTATETELQLWADVDALHYWAPIYDDLVGRARSAEYVAVVRRVAGRAVANRLADDPAMPALAVRLAALEEAGYDAGAVLAAVTADRELHSAHDVAAVLAWRIDNMIGRIVPDPKVATSRERAASFRQRMPAATGEVGDALRQVAEICDRRVAGLAELAALRQPEWAAGLGPVPDDDTGRRQWLTRAAVVITYRDRYTVRGADPIGPEPPTRDPARWGAWLRARIVLGIATLTGRVAAATDAELDAMVAAQRAADAAAPEYVGDQLRDAHTALVGAEQHVRDLRFDLVAVQADKTRAEKLVAARAPQWWHVGPVGARAAAERTAAQLRVTRATQQVDALRTRLTHAVAKVQQQRAVVTRLEAQHGAWTTWYTEALPIRHAGLAANAERTRRLAIGVDDLADAVRDTTARVRAIDATAPRPQAMPIAEYLGADADAARERIVEPAPADHVSDLEP